MALPVNEHLNAVIIIQLSSKSPLLAARHRMGNSTHAHTFPGRRYPDDPT